MARGRTRNTASALRRGTGKITASSMRRQHDGQICLGFCVFEGGILMVEPRVPQGKTPPRVRRIACRLCHRRRVCQLFPTVSLHAWGGGLFLIRRKMTCWRLLAGTRKRRSFINGDVPGNVMNTSQGHCRMECVLLSVGGVPAGTLAPL